MTRMPDTPHNEPDPKADAPAELPDRMCAWCKVPMLKRLVGEGKFIHYTCPKCIFQHTSKREQPPA